MSRNSIMESAYDSILTKRNIDLDLLKEFILEANKGDRCEAVRTALILSGKIKKPLDVPKNCIVDIDATKYSAEFTGMQFWQNKVYFKYTRVLVGYFKTQEEADAFSKSGSMYNIDCRPRKTKLYSFKGECSVERYDYCTVDDWLSYAEEKNGNTKNKKKDE